MSYKIKVYQDEKKEFRWNITAGNNKTIGASTEGYENKSDALKNMADVAAALAEFAAKEGPHDNWIDSFK